MIAVGKQCILFSKKTKALSLGLVLFVFYGQIHPRVMERWDTDVKMNLCYTFIQVKTLSWGLVDVRELPQPSG